MSETAIKSEMRLAVIEYLVSKLYVAFAEQAGWTVEQMAAVHQSWLAEPQLFPMQNPALSDLASAEWELAMSRLLDAQRAMLAQSLAQK